MTPTTALILAAAGQVALTAVAMARLSLARVPAVRRGEVRKRDIATNRSAYPPRMHKLSDNVLNQFETPVLYFAVIAIALAAGVASWTLVWLAVAWLATRAVHMAIHTATNNVVHRFYAFTAGSLLLAVMWLVLVAAALA